MTIADSYDITNKQIEILAADMLARVDAESGLPIASAAAHAMLRAASAFIAGQVSAMTAYMTLQALADEMALRIAARGVQQ